MLLAKDAVLSTFELPNKMLESAHVRSVSLCSVYWCSAIRNAYYGSHSNLYDKDKDFHADLTSAKCHVELSRKPGTRFQISEHPVLLVSLSDGRLVGILDMEHQTIPFAAPRPGDISIETLRANDLLGALSKRYDVHLFCMREEKAPVQMSLPLRKYSSRPNHDGTLSFDESISKAKTHALVYMLQKIGAAIASLKNGNPYSFSPFSEMQIKKLAPPL